MFIQMSLLNSISYMKFSQASWKAFFEIKNQAAEFKNEILIEKG